MVCNIIPKTVYTKKIMLFKRFRYCSEKSFFFLFKKPTLQSTNLTLDACFPYGKFICSKLNFFFCLFRSFCSVFLMTPRHYKGFKYIDILDNENTVNFYLKLSSTLKIPYKCDQSFSSTMGVSHTNNNNNFVFSKINT